ncbi:hypothetical protein niasHS_009734 [Heterodera schachtii]|uniref:BTB domain-containing protein n=1 Tax=Heterodera schachtii TaxID=97005 RepID=A0ABD2IY54_HETSC
MEIFDEYIIVDEKSFSINIGSKFNEVTQFAAMDFSFAYNPCRLIIKDIGNATLSDVPVPLAQIIVWEWDAQGAQVIKETKTLNTGGTLTFMAQPRANNTMGGTPTLQAQPNANIVGGMPTLQAQQNANTMGGMPAYYAVQQQQPYAQLQLVSQQGPSNYGAPNLPQPATVRLGTSSTSVKPGTNQPMMPVSPTQSVLVRLLKKRENKDENPCPPLSSPADDLTVHIGNRKITVSAAWLMCQSPMVRQMLSVEMKEKQQRSLILNELGIDMEQFMDFLEAISSNALLFPILPNPKNVLPLLILADYFQVEWVKTRCANHLINCVEIPLIDRFLLAIRYHLDSFKDFFFNLSAKVLRAFFKANRDQFSLMSSDPNSGKLFFEFANRLSADTDFGEKPMPNFIS